jgi:antitoxin VapB
METAKIFRNGQSQAVRLPKKFRFDGDTVFIKRQGAAIVLLPVKNSWDSLFNSLEKFTDDFMENRGQTEQQIREDMFK